MIVKNRFTDEVKEISYHNISSLKNPEDYIIIQADLVYSQIIKEGQKIDRNILDRLHAINIIKNNTDRYAMREISLEEKSKISSRFFSCDDKLFLSKDWPYEIPKPKADIVQAIIAKIEKYINSISIFYNKGVLTLLILIVGILSLIVSIFFR